MSVFSCVLTRAQSYYPNLPSNSYISLLSFPSLSLSLSLFLINAHTRKPQATESPHIEFHLKWAEGLLLNHGSHIMAERSTYSAALRSMHMGFSRQFGDVSRLCQNNHYALAYLSLQPSEKVAPSGVAAGAGPALPEVGASGKAKKKERDL